MIKILFTSILLFCMSLYSQIKIPKNFSELTESPANGKKIEKIVMDFDHDSINDIAVLVKSEVEFSNYRFLIYLTKLNKQFEVNLNNSDFSIYPIQLKANKNTIQFGYFEDGTAAFGRFIRIRYNSKRQKVQVIGYDTTYKSSPTEYSNKSYNLITGRYIVTKTIFNTANKTSVNEFKGQNNLYKNKVFIDDLTAKMLENLDHVGNKYE